MMKYQRLLIFILVVNLLTRISLVSRPLSNLDGKMIPDDAYYSWQIAKSIADGKGPLYGDSYTNGFQPLYVFLVAPFFHWSPSLITPIKLSLLLLSFFDTATLAVILSWIASFSKNRLILLTVALVWIVNDYILRQSLNGLETMMSCFFITLGTYIFYRIFYLTEKRKWHHFLLLGIVVGLGCFTRVDNLILALIIGLFILIHERKTFYPMVRNAALFGIGVFLIFSVWMIYSIHFVGSWFPQSGAAVRFLSLARVDHHPTWLWYRDMLVSGTKTILRENGALLFFIFGLFSYLIVKKGVKPKSWLEKALPLFVFCATIFFCYTLYIFTEWFFPRYLFPFNILFILSLAVLLHQFEEMVPGKRFTWCIAGLFLIWMANVAVRGKYIDYFWGPENKELGYMNLGLWAKKNLPDSSVVGSAQSGALKYFATNLNVVNLDGVVNKKCFLSLQQGKTLDYMRSVHMKYVIDWSLNIDFIKKHINNFKDPDLVFVKKIEGFRSWRLEWGLYMLGEWGEIQGRRLQNTANAQAVRHDED